MRILIDIVHMADVNFYKNAVQILKKQGHEFIFSVMKRNNLPEFVKKELGSAFVVGIHVKGNLLRKAYFNLKRILQLRKLIKNIKPDAVTSFSYYPAAAVFGKNIPSIIFHDDAEYKMQFMLCKLFAKRLIIPDFIKSNGKNIKKYHSYKEWAYLNPKYFKPKTSILKKYKLKKYNYVFIREVAPVSLNYAKKSNIDYPKIISLLKKKKLKVVVSLEDWSRDNEFKGAIILKEPVSDFYSIIYYSLALISSGDTMAREAALLGAPSFYKGNREMIVNKELVRRKILTIANDENALTDYLKKISVEGKHLFNRKIKYYARNLDDTTRIIVNELTKNE